MNEATRLRKELAEMRREHFEVEQRFKELIQEREDLDLRQNLSRKSATMR